MAGRLGSAGVLLVCKLQPCKTQIRPFSNTQWQPVKSVLCARRSNKQFQYGIKPHNQPLCRHMSSSKSTSHNPEYKLTYFSLHARGEPIRLLFAVAGVPYSEEKIERPEWYASPDHKQRIAPPFGQIPILSIDGQVFCQSLCIGYHLAEKYGLAGKSDMDKFRCNMIAHCCEDVATMMVLKIFRETDPDRKEQARNFFITQQLPTYCYNLERMLKENKEGKGFFVGDSLTWADLIFYNHFTSLMRIIDLNTNDFIGSYPLLKALIGRVENVPSVAAWLAKRPAALF